MRTRKQTRAGFSLVETAIALGVLGVALGGMTIMEGDANQQAKDNAAASYITQIQTAAVAYWNVNQQAIKTAVAAQGGAIRIGISLGDPSDQGLPTLAGGGFLPIGGTDSVPGTVGQTIRLTYAKDGSGNLDGLIYTLGGAPTPDLDLGRIALKLGATGGVVPLKPVRGAAGYVMGSGGAWSISADTFVTSDGAEPTAGHAGALVGFFGANGSLTDFLYRDNIGIPAANTMNTDINMAGASGSVGIDKASNIDTQSLDNTQGAAIAVGSAKAGTALNLYGGTGINACADSQAGCGVQIGNVGSIIQSKTNPGWMQVQGGTNGLFVSNAGGSSGALAVSGATTLWGTTGAVGTLTTASGITMSNAGLTGNGTTGVTLNGGSVSLTGGQVALASGATVAFNDVGMSLSALNAGAYGSYIQANGNFLTSGVSVVQGYVNTPKVVDLNNGAYYLQPSQNSVLNTVNFAGGTLTADGLHVYDSSGNQQGFVNAEGTVYSAGQTVAAGGLVTWLAASKGAACPTSGTIAQDGSTGNMLWCQGGLWTLPASNGLGVVGPASNAHSGFTGPYTCPAGYGIRELTYNPGDSNDTVWFECVPN
jgi:hypothetical protein